MKMDSLGDRMKGYEKIPRNFLIKRVPVIMRLDGRAFHQFTKKYCERPFDNTFQKCMIKTAETLLSEIQGAKAAYVQSDEITILITDFDTINTEPWFGYNVQKMCSVGAAIATSKFNYEFNKMYEAEIHMGDNDFFKAQFDCRVFNIPKDDVYNNFLWRQQDWLRNSIQMYTRSFYSHKELECKNTTDMHEMLYAKGKNWATDLDESWKNGVFISRHHTLKYDQTRPGYEHMYFPFKGKFKVFDDLMNLPLKKPIEE